MSQRAVRLAVLTGGALAGLLTATITPAAAQGDPVYGEGNVYYLSGAYNPDGQAQAIIEFGDRGDEVYFGGWDGDAVDSIAIRRDNEYFVKNDHQKTGVADRRFFYGDAEDAVLVGNWDGEVVAPVTGEDDNGDGDYSDP